jgi:hypothetical protein
MRAWIPKITFLANYFSRIVCWNINLINRTKVCDLTNTSVLTTEFLQIMGIRRISDTHAYIDIQALWWDDEGVIELLVVLGGVWQAIKNVTPQNYSILKHECECPNERYNVTGNVQAPQLTWKCWTIVVLLFVSRTSNIPHPLIRNLKYRYEILIA